MSVSTTQTNEFYLRLLDVFEESQAMSYRYYDERHTYQDMYAQMRKFNSVLSQHKNKQIVLYGDKRFSTYAAIFSIIISRNTWIPLSPENPEQRNLDILEQTTPAIIIHDGSLPKKLQQRCLQKKISLFSYAEILEDYDGVNFERGKFDKDDIAYIMFTSGSTGTPKGVPMTHENYINFVNNALEILPFGGGEVFSDFHDFAFDISIFYLFACPLTEGAFSPIIAAQDKIIPLSHIVENQVTVWASVPSVMNMIKTFRPLDKIKTPIKIMFLCGEPLKLDVLRYCFENLELKNVYNFYGLTETGVENFYHRCMPDDPEKYINFGMAPIGRPLPGNMIMMSGNKELYIAGCQVTPGYLGNDSFGKFEEIENVVWYKTGDIVEQFEDVYFCKGRVDSQVKLGGHRVELSDIEAHIVKHKHVDMCICFVNDAKGKKTLVAAVKPDGEFDFKEIQKNLGKELPKYMIPSDHMLLDSIPINANGKLDRKKIKAAYQNRISL